MLNPTIPVVDAETGEELARGVIPDWSVAVQSWRMKEFAGGTFGAPIVLIVKHLTEGERHDKAKLNDILRDHGVATALVSEALARAERRSEAMGPLEEALKLLARPDSQEEDAGVKEALAETHHSLGLNFAVLLDLERARVKFQQTIDVLTGLARKNPSP